MTPTTVHLRLAIGGVDVIGPCTTRTPDLVGTIECLSYHHGLSIAQSSHNALDEAHRDRMSARTYEPISITKEVDQTTCRLLDAVHNSRDVDAEFRFCRPNKQAAGSVEHYATVRLTGRIASIEQMRSDETSAGFVEQLTFSPYSSFEWEYIDEEDGDIFDVAHH